VQCCVTSPPYWGLRDYGCAGQIGREKTPQEYVATMVAVFREVRRILKDDGTLWLNLGDSYCNTDKWGGFSGGKHTVAEDGTIPSAAVRAKRNAIDGLKPKDICGIPWRVAFALQADGWWLRQDIIWHKPNPMPESVTDRCTKAHEYIFLMTKSARYFYDAEAISEPAIAGMDLGLLRGKHANGCKTMIAWHEPSIKKRQDANVDSRAAGDGFRNKRSVWTVPSAPYSEAHFATFPPNLIKPCILAGSKTGDTILDPFGGSGTTGQVATELGRDAILVELNENYIPLIRARTNTTQGLAL